MLKEKANENPSPISFVCVQEIRSSQGTLNMSSLIRSNMIHWLIARLM